MNHCSFPEQKNWPRKWISCKDIPILPVQVPQRLQKEEEPAQDQMD